MRWPRAEYWPLPIIHTGSLESCGPTLLLNSLSLEQAAGTVWPSANLAIYVPFELLMPSLVLKLLLWAGNSNGHVDVGLYDAAGTRIVSSGSTVTGGVDVVQAFDIADTLIGPGRFYWGVAADGTTVAAGRYAPAAGVSVLQALGALQQATAFPLPAVATFATITNNYLPVAGCAFRTLI